MISSLIITNKIRRHLPQKEYLISIYLHPSVNLMNTLKLNDILYNSCIRDRYKGKNEFKLIKIFTLLFLSQILLSFKHVLEVCLSKTALFSIIC